MSAARKTRVEHGLRDVLQSAITNDVRDPRVRAATMVTVSKVEVNVDMSVARVYVSIVGDEATADGVIAALQKAAGFLRGPVGRELNLQYAPELRFIADLSVDMSDKLAAILREDAERARAAGRVVGEAEPTPLVEPTPPAESDAEPEAPEAPAVTTPPASKDEA